jgi:preprotein translocase subunit SecA
MYAMQFLKRFLPDPNKQTLNKLYPLVNQINELEPTFQAKSNEDLRAYTSALQERFRNGETLDDLLPEAFALVRETAQRTLGMRHFDVQLIGGIALHKGYIGEMKTGEGKTLVATLPAYLNALSGNGVHIVTVNDYLARRDTVWMGQIFYFLGLNVGAITSEGAFLYTEEGVPEEQDADRDSHASYNVEDDYLTSVERKAVYGADVVYGTNNEFGFDYLRDNMAQSLEDMVQRELNFCIIDEVDSVLIDEARTPLIISAPDAESPQLYKTFARIVPRLEQDTDYTVDEQMNGVSLTDTGIDKVEQALGIDNLYQEKGVVYVHHLEQALKAQALFKNETDYVVREGQVIIVDQFTGRLMPGRRFGEGLHQALEAKEGLNIQQESKTMATITFQNFFRMYNKLAGMTGTALTSAEEFDKVYSLGVVSIPTHEPVRRQDLADKIYKTEQAKFNAIAANISERQERGQPVLVGTVSIEKSERLADLLKRRGVRCDVLNAKHHESEGAVIANAGKKRAVTIATNMAGRGVDIKLGGPEATDEEKQEVMELGGLHILGTERHEARRIDNQLRGRSGRQGEPGSTQFYLSLDDDMMRVFATDWIRSIMERTNLPEEDPIEHPLIAKAVEHTQTKIEGYNFDARKHLLEYDNVINKQREIIYEKRRHILDGTTHIEDLTSSLLEEYVYRIVSFHTSLDTLQDWDIGQMIDDLSALSPLDNDVRQELENIRDKETDIAGKKTEMSQVLTSRLSQYYEARFSSLDDETREELQRKLYLQAIDILWMEHLEVMDYLKTGVRLRGYAQKDPLVEYKNEGFRLFENLLGSISEKYITNLFHVHVHAPMEAASYNPYENAQEHHASSSATTQSTSNQGETAHEPQTQRVNDKVGRNDACPCGSGKKAKKCHPEYTN